MKNCERQIMENENSLPSMQKSPESASPINENSFRFPKSKRELHSTDESGSFRLLMNVEKSRTTSIDVE
jgi:hypothetical protein